MLKTCPQSGLVQADAVCALCTQATCTHTRKRSLSNVVWLNDLPAEYVLSHLVSSTHLELMKASTSRSWKNAHSANPSQHSHSLPGFASRLVPLGSRRRQPRVCPAFLNDSRSLTCETRCHKIPSERLYNALKRCVSLQRRAGANYSLLETREIHLQHRTSDHKAPRAYFCCI